MTAFQIELLTKIGIGLGAALISGTPSFIAWLKARKAAKNARTEDEKKAAEADMIKHMKEFITNAESAYKQVDIILKNNKDTAGPLKKDSVMSKLIAYASSKGYGFDEEYWSTKIDEEVAFTRGVNAK